MLVEGRTDVHETGELGLVGSLACVECGYSISLSHSDQLPSCPACGGSRFRRISMFESPTLNADAISPAPALPAWLDGVRADLEPGDQFVVFEDGGEPVVVGLQAGWTRIGRSGSADIQLDDATVSRRHALIVRTADDQLRALDDRSLNGLFINGERVEWAPLNDGDELEIGRYRLYVLQT
jgi:predicted  nucleic acid-binding Zn-ribbon protein